MRRRIHTELANAFYLGFSDVRRALICFFSKICYNMFCPALNLERLSNFAEVKLTFLETEVQRMKKKFNDDDHRRLLL